MLGRYRNPQFAKISKIADLGTQIDHLNYMKTEYKCRQGHGETGGPVLCQWEGKMMQQLWKAVSRAFQRTENRITM